MRRSYRMEGVIHMYLLALNLPWAMHLFTLPQESAHKTMNLSVGFLKIISDERKWGGGISWKLASFGLGVGRA